MNRTTIPHRHMMATVALHLLGDISRDTPDICSIYAEEGENWIGAWVTGCGFFDVYFPKATTRELTEEEKTTYRAASYQISDQPPYKLDIS